MDNTVLVNSQFTGFDYDDEKNTLRLTFDLIGGGTKKFIKSQIKLGAFCKLQIIFNDEKDK